MYAIVNIAGQQFKVEKGNRIFVHRLAGEVGTEVSFDSVMMIEEEGKIRIGHPYLTDKVVMAQILSHLRGDKIQVFKKKRKKGYQVLNGHRQNFTELLIEEIGEATAQKKTSGAKTHGPAAVEADAVSPVSGMTAPVSEEPAAESQKMNDTKKPEAAKIKKTRSASGAEAVKSTSGKASQKPAETASSERAAGVKKASKLPVAPKETKPAKPAKVKKEDVTKSVTKAKKVSPDATNKGEK